MNGRVKFQVIFEQIFTRSRYQGELSLKNSPIKFIFYNNFFSAGSLIFMNVGKLGGRIPFCVSFAPSYPRVISSFYSIFDVDKTLEEINFFLTKLC